MSLINDMLRDLDGYTEASSDKQSLQIDLTPEKKKTSVAKRLWLPALAIVTVLYAVIFEWNGLGLFPEQKTTPVEIPAPIALNSKWLNVPAENPASPSREGKVVLASVEEKSPDNNFSASDNNAAASISATHDSDSAAQAIQQPSGIQLEKTDEKFSEGESASNIAVRKSVERLLIAADSALTEDRLTSPAGNNAYQYFKSALLLDSENANALQGISSIQERYLSWLKRALAEQRYPAARLYMERARAVGVPEHTLAAYAKNLAAESASTTLVPAENNTDAVVGSVERAVSVGNSTKEMAGNTTNIKNYSGDMSDDASDKSSMITLAVNSDVEMAANLRARGWRSEPETLGWLAGAPEIEQTAVTLADFYAAQSRLAKLQTLAGVLTQRAHPASAYAAAQAAILSGNERNAVDRLAAVEFFGMAEERRLRLLAGMQQKIGDSNTAMELYSRLIRMAPGNVTDWLGLAVSADSSGHKNTALNAYEKVLQLRHPDSRVMQFARQRLQDLSLTAQAP